MSGNQPDLSRDEREPPLNLERESYGYIVLSGGIAAAILTLSYMPDSVLLERLVGYAIVLGIATGTIHAYQYVVGPWYEQFENSPDTDS